MRYLGGKTRLASYILPHILKHRTSNEQWFIDAFCGGCNVIDKVEGNRIALDSNDYLIALWKVIQAGWTPPSIVSEKTYNHVKQNKEKYPKTFGELKEKLFVSTVKTERLVIG